MPFGENTVVSGATTVVDYSGIWDKYHFICGGGNGIQGKYRGILGEIQGYLG